MLNFSSIYVDHVHYTGFGRQRLSPLLSNINLSVKRGEMTALVGKRGRKKPPAANGSGTLTRELTDAWEIRLEGKAIDSRHCATLRGNTLCYIPQGVGSLNPF